MHLVDHSVTAKCSAAEAFDFMAEPSNDYLWRGDLKEITFESDGDLGVGTRYHQVFKAPLGIGVRADFELTEFARPARMAFHTYRGLVRPDGFLEFSDGDGNTTIHLVLEWHPPRRLLNFAGKLVSMKMQHDTERDFEQLREHLERGAEWRGNN